MQLVVLTGEVNLKRWKDVDLDALGRGAGSGDLVSATRLPLGGPNTRVPCVSSEQQHVMSRGSRMHVRPQERVHERR